MKKKKVRRCLHKDCTHFMLGAEQNNMTITVPVDSGILLTLPDNPSTGFLWELAENNASILMQMKDPEHTPIRTHTDKGELLVGGGGHVLWRFWAGQPGTSTLTLCHRRPWLPIEEDELAETFTCTINVTNTEVTPIVEAVHV
jgi:inhibitor of cysteine peptidase